MKALGVEEQKMKKKSRGLEIWKSLDDNFEWFKAKTNIKGEQSRTEDTGTYRYRTRA
jgi:hypothetical protein